jgi:hypothetical protein
VRLRSPSSASTRPPKREGGSKKKTLERSFLYASPMLSRLPFLGLPPFTACLRANCRVGCRTNCRVGFLRAQMVFGRAGLVSRDAEHCSGFVAGLNGSLVAGIPPPLSGRTGFAAGTFSRFAATAATAASFIWSSRGSARTSCRVESGSRARHCRARFATASRREDQRNSGTRPPIVHGFTIPSGAAPCTTTSGAVECWSRTSTITRVCST